MLEAITLGDIGVMVAFLVALISGVSFLLNHVKKSVEKIVKEQIAPITERLSDLEKDIESVDIENCKNFLVRFLADVEQGIIVDEIEKERFWEQYEHYTKGGHNGYIKNKVSRLQEKGLL